MSLHADALAELSAWVAPDDAQERLRRRYVDLLAARPDAMTRDCFPDHLTAGVLVFSHDTERVLLNLHRKAGIWVAFGGHCEPGDTTLAGVALREGLEESGLDALDLDPVPAQLDVHPVGFCDPRGTVHHLDVRFVARARVGAAHEASEESLDVRWWPVDRVPTEEASMLELIRVGRARLQADSPRTSSAMSSSGSSSATSPGGGSMSAPAE